MKPKKITRILYGLPALPLSVLFLPAIMILPEYYAYDLGMGLSLAGGVFLVARLIDMMSDPIVGLLSDKYPFWGRRRTGWILAGSLLTVVVTWLVFVPYTPMVGPTYLFITIVLLYIGWTMVQVPLYALGAEISPDYHERTGVMAAREAGLLLGGVVALSLYALGENDRISMIYIALFITATLPLFSFMLFRRDPVQRKKKQYEELSFKAGWTALKKNKPLRQTVMAYLTNGLANGIPATTFILFIEQGLQRPDLKGVLLLGYFLSGLIFLPLWVKLSKRFGKAPVWRWAMLWTVLVFSCVLFVSPGDVWLFSAIVILSGMTVGADLALPSSIQADVIDIDRLETGQERAGLFYAIWGVVTKFSMAIAVGIAFPVLAVMGCEPGSCSDLMPLKIVYGGMPVAIKLIAVMILWKDPVTLEEHNEIRAKIEKMNKKDKSVEKV